MTNEADIEAIRALEYDIEAACVAADATKLAGICADDFTFTHGNNIVEPKASWLTTFPIPGRFQKREISDLAIEVHPDVAYVFGQADIEATDRTYGLKYLRLYAKRDGAWRWLSQRTIQPLRTS
jgi:ketosteroid isomerase-like protein